MEIWGGIECTINRVGDKYMDQLEYSGHYNRLEDLDLLAGLGIKKLRYPVLWEKHQPESGQEIDWTATSIRLSRLLELDVEPIVGLVHHGSGPAYVSIADESFATGLADYAGKVAKKFPWIKYYTPVNEPLTTARFCGLYGIWHPHGSSAETFLRILINECKATVLAMQTIKEVNPEAMLVQTEDMGRTHSTRALRYQADFENHRRWLSLDLLCGKVDENHALYKHLTDNGITSEDLSFFLNNPCPPDIVGINHYLTSERYIDEKLAIYPEHTHGGNGKHRYADVELVRVGCKKAYGPYRILKEVWNRYRLPIAVTEVHLHCTREEQMRWFSRVLEDARRLEKEQADIRAVTAWALLGSFGWNCLLRQECGDYEAGVFDVSSGTPRPTAMSTLIREAAAGILPKHPLLKQKGWWERDVRVLYHKTIPLRSTKPVSAGPALLIVAKSGVMGSTFVRLCELRNIPYMLISRTQLRLSAEINPKDLCPREIWAVVDVADSHPQYRKNAGAGPDLNTARKSGALAAFTKAHNIRMVTFSLDLLTEHYVMLQNQDALMIRTGVFLSSEWHQSPKLSSKRVQWVSFTSTDVRELVNSTLDLLLDDERGIWHLVNPKQQELPASIERDTNVRVYL
ncbi:dTDP-4-dehydrorhamnose reductase [Arcticibacter pallidicorallinus]|uniref:dTDP-4-dehydrorhamnose reductase n=1 Tax=Arcticibacter pallidicorallinus TaxID=1259464 RepID=A0A2T0UBP3_9SPHI|nr:family 1 glycosylhydrolase [Arcticibacter pallidicorallinus]PRY55333.1 dTDP-4-dehydrorhamnose reductase [Arcticibacter pallidicorallinus]